MRNQGLASKVTNRTSKNKQYKYNTCDTKNKLPANIKSKEQICEWY